MRWFLIKTYLVVALLSLTSLVVSVYFFALPFLISTEFQIFEKESYAERQILTRQLDVEKDIEVIEQYAPVFDHVISIVESDSLEPAEIEELSKIGIVPAVESDDTWYILFKSPISNDIIRIEEGTGANWVSTDLWEVILAFCLVSLTYGFSIYFVMRAVTNPLNKFLNAIKGIRTGSTNHRISKVSPPMEELAEAFNAMSEALDEQKFEQLSLLSAIPHELRTPLSRMQAAVDLAEYKETVPDLQNQLKKVSLYIDQLNETINDVLELTRLESSNLSTSEEVDLRNIIELAIPDFQSGKYDIETTFSGEALARGNYRLIRRCVHNLLANAANYTQSKILISVHQSDSQCELKIQDNGPGVPDDQLKAIFRPFYRLDESRSRNTGSIGLGLALVNRIVGLHGGSVSAKNASPQGLIVTLILPA